MLISVYKGEFMKKIGFIIVLQLAHAVYASASAGQPVSITEESIIWDYENPECKFAGTLNRACFSLAIIDGFGETIKFVSDFESKINNARKDVAAATDAVPDAMKKRALEFFGGVVRRVNYAYTDLLQTASKLAPKQAELILEYGSSAESSTCIDFPQPINSKNAPKGKEQAACDWVKELSNLQANYQKEKALLVGVRTINNNQLLMFLTGAKQVVLDGKVIAANQLTQDLYAAYANPNSDIASIYALEAAAAQYLLRDKESLRLTYFDALTYNLNKEFAHCPDEKKREEVLDKQAILTILSKKTAMQIPTALPVALVQKKVRMFTGADDKLLADISKLLENISIIQATGQTANGGYSVANESIMDYGTENGKYAIKPEVRLAVQNLLQNQFSRRGVKVPEMTSFKVCLPVKKVFPALGVYAVSTQRGLDNNGMFSETAEFSGFYAVAAALDAWVDEMQLKFAEKERNAIKMVLFKMSTSYPQDMSNNYLKFVNSLWKMRALYNYYENWYDKEEKGGFLDALKTAAYQNFVHVTEQLLNEGGQLRCLTGANGRAFLVDLSMVEFLRDKHPEFAAH